MIERTNIEEGLALCLRNELSRSTNLEARVQELEEEVRILKSDQILHQSLGGSFSLHKVVLAVKQHYVERALLTTKNNRKHATRLLGLNYYQSLDRIINRLGLQDVYMTTFQRRKLARAKDTTTTV